MEATSYITPTKERPVFVSINTYTGYKINGCYKDWELQTEKSLRVGDTTALNLTDAIRETHEYIKENQEYIEEFVKFEINMIDGSVDKWGDPIMVKCYSISMKQAKRFRII